MNEISDLKKYWKSIKGKKDVLTFYSSVKLPENSPDYNYFSNYWISEDPFNFTIPEWCGKFKNKKINIHFSIKAIMLCKASLMGDEQVFNDILECSTPFGCEKLSNNIACFDENKWLKNIINISFAVVFAKFNSNSELKQKLIDTGERIIAETAEYNTFWGIGMDRNNINNQYPTYWKGFNLLGWTLMEVRKKLISENSENH